MRDALEEVRRADDAELEGFVRRRGDAAWEALTVFGGVLATTQSPGEARAVVHSRGLASLAERWCWWSRATHVWSVVVPQEVRPGMVRVAVGYYALAGVPSAVITAEDLADGDRLVLEVPDGPVDGHPEAEAG